MIGAAVLSAGMLPRHHRHRRRPAGLFRTLSQTSHARMGAPVAQRLAVRQGAAPPTYGQKRLPIEPGCQQRAPRVLDRKGERGLVQERVEQQRH